MRCTCGCLTLRLPQFLNMLPVLGPFIPCAFTHVLLPFFRSLYGCCTSLVVVVVVAVVARATLVEHVTTVNSLTVVTCSCDSALPSFPQWRPFSGGATKKRCLLFGGALKNAEFLIKYQIGQRSVVVVVVVFFLTCYVLLLFLFYCILLLPLSCFFIRLLIAVEIAVNVN